MDVYIHAGTFKTGSTAVQQCLFSLRDELTKQSILYPKSGISAQAEEIGHRHSRFVYEYGLHSWEAEVENLVAEIREHKPDLLILSSEAWSKPKGTKRLLALLERLRIFNIDNVDVTFVVRNGFDYSISFYREFVRRWGQRRTYQAYTEKRIPYYDYNNLFLPFLEVDKLNVKFIPYSADCVDRILKEAGVTNQTQKRELEANSSLSALDIEIQRRINIITKSKAHPAPTACDLFKEIGLNQQQDKVIESTPPESLINLYSDNYKREFSALTGLSASLLDVESSHYFKDNNIELSLFSPILDYLLPNQIKTK